MVMPSTPFEVDALVVGVGVALGEEERGMDIDVDGTGCVS
jgi:hypothetical protein